MLYYTCTRDKKFKISASEAIVKGIAKGGGLFVPEYFPKFDISFKELADYSYQDLAAYVLGKYLTDFTAEEIEYCVQNAYNQEKFDEGIVNIHECARQAYLELYHGRTIAFKDMALSILPYLMTVAAKKLNIKEKIVILTATSGDTGKAALEGFADVEGVSVIVFYPKGGVSRIQELQMQTQKGKNVHVVGIKGNFDDAQTAVKGILSDEELKIEILKKGCILSSANSINIGRLVPQIVYYIYAYLQLLKKELIKEGEKINITVPTGNFGNILAAYYAKQMGLPVHKLVCASNTNKVLTDFFLNGEYDKNREFYLTNSPSMDILVSSNLERLLYHLSGEDATYVGVCMDELNTKGMYPANEKVRQGFSDFIAGFATQEETLFEIKRVFETYSYVVDTHTAVASHVYRVYQESSRDMSYNIIASTASPYKFLRAVYPALSDEGIDSTDDFELSEKFSRLSETRIPNAVSELKTAEILHDAVIEKSEIVQAVLKRV